MCDEVRDSFALPCPRLSAASLLAAGVLTLSGCAEATRAPVAPSAAAAVDGSARSGEIERFLPLKAETVFSYHAWLPESVDPELLILQVERPSARFANLRSGSSVKRIEFVPDGVRLVTGGYLLKAPISAGADWAGPAGRVRVTGMELEVNVAAGHFVGCLETTESDARGASPRTISTTYCPGVGIVKFSVGDAERQERFELKSFGARVNVDQL
ncbi:MAG: hypothetical protein RL685_253 [Pseudomonadota bacterium]|jgi:hypothetical protein